MMKSAKNGRLIIPLPFALYKFMLLGPKRAMANNVLKGPEDP